MLEGAPCMRLKAMSQTFRLMRLRNVKAYSGIVPPASLEGANAQTESPSCRLSSGHCEIKDTEKFFLTQIAKLAVARVGMAANFSLHFLLVRLFSANQPERERSEDEMPH